MAFCSGDLVALWQRLGLSALVTLAAVKNAGLAAGALTFPLWWPLLQAAGRNRALRSRFRCAVSGFWYRFRSWPARSYSRTPAAGRQAQPRAALALPVRRAVLVLCASPVPRCQAVGYLAIKCILDHVRAIGVVARALW